jgi:hypothetical protein
LSGGHRSIVQIIIDAGSTIRPYSSLLLDIACRRKRVDLVRLLLEAGAVGAKAPPYGTVFSDSTEILELLIS